MRYFVCVAILTFCVPASAQSWVQNQINAVENNLLCPSHLEEGTIVYDSPSAKLANRYPITISDIVTSRSENNVRIYIKGNYGFAGYFSYNTNDEISVIEGKLFLSKLYAAYTGGKTVYFYMSTKPTDPCRIVYIDYDLSNN